MSEAGAEAGQRALPPGRVIDFDIYAVAADGQGFFESWLALAAPGRPKLLWSTAHGGHWIALDGETIRWMIGDAQTFSNAILTVPPELSALAELIPLQSDPPEHGRYRSPVLKAFGAKHVLALEPQIRALARDLIAQVASGGGCDFVTDYAERLPIHTFLSLIDLPESDRVFLRNFGEQLNRPDGSMTPEQMISGLSDYLRPYVMDRLERPGSDLLSRILAAGVDGRPWTAEEAMRLARNLLLGGLDTVAALMGFAMHFLAQSPEHRARLAGDRAIIPKAADEFIRRFGSVSVGRVATRDVEHDGVTVRRGDIIILPTMLANLGAGDVADPLAVDFDRGNVPHSTMGHGPHRCVGAGLARLELICFLEEWFAHIPEFTLNPADPPRMRGGGVGSLLSLPLQWPVR